MVKAGNEENSCHDGKVFVKDKETMPFLWLKKKNNVKDRFIQANWTKNIGIGNDSASYIIAETETILFLNINIRPR